MVFTRLLYTHAGFKRGRLLLNDFIQNIFLKRRDDEILVKKLGDAKKNLSETLGLYVSM